MATPEHKLEHSVQRSIVIQADRETVFRFFTGSERWAAWWGAGSTIDPRPGGELRVRHMNGFVSVGNVIEIAAPERFSFTFSMQTNPPTPPEHSRVTIRLHEHPGGTLVQLTHEVADATVAGLLVQGWRFHLSMFSNAVADEVNANAAGLVDEWFALWTEPDADARAQTLARITVPGLTFRDRYSALEGAAEVETHIGASQRFMPGVRLERRGAVRHCQGTVLADWIALGKDGQERMSGTNVFRLGLAGTIESVTGIANPAAATA